MATLTVSNKPYRRLTEVIPAHNFSETRLTLNDIKDKDVVIKDGVILDSNFGGNYALIECEDGEGKAFSIATSAMNIVEAVMRLKEQNAFPVIARFTKEKTRRGREVWVIL